MTQPTPNSTELTAQLAAAQARLAALDADTLRLETVSREHQAAAAAARQAVRAGTMGLQDVVAAESLQTAAAGVLQAHLEEVGQVRGDVVRLASRMRHAQDTEREQQLRQEIADRLARREVLADALEQQLVQALEAMLTNEMERGAVATELWFTLERLGRTPSYRREDMTLYRANPVQDLVDYLTVQYNRPHSPERHWESLRYLEPMTVHVWRQMQARGGGGWPGCRLKHGQHGRNATALPRV